MRQPKLRVFFFVSCWATVFPTITSAQSPFTSRPPVATTDILAGPNASSEATTPKPESVKNSETSTAQGKSPDLPASGQSSPALGTTDKHGLNFRIGGLVHLDGGWYDAQKSLAFPGGTGPYQDGVTPRRLRLRSEGELGKGIDFNFEIEFVNSFTPVPGVSATNSNTYFSPGLTNAWVTIHDLPIIENLRIGQQKEPISLEHITTAKNLEFMERSYLFDANQASAYNNARSPGIAAFRTFLDDRVYAAAGVFKNISDQYAFGVGDGQYAATGRIGFLPFYCPDDEHYWYVGCGVSRRDPVNGQVVVRVRESVRAEPSPLLNLIANTGAINATSQELLDLETAAAVGPFTFQGEYLANRINNASVGVGPVMGDVVFQGYYAEMMFLITGEHRGWDPKNGTYARAGIIPKHPFRAENGEFEGLGAWECVGCVWCFGLDDRSIKGGRLTGVTLGVNWYWNAHSKMQFNYDYLYRDDAANPIAKGIVHAFGILAAYDF